MRPNHLTPTITPLPVEPALAEPLIVIAPPDDMTAPSISTPSSLDDELIAGAANGSSPPPMTMTPPLDWIVEPAKIAMLPPSTPS